MTDIALQLPKVRQRTRIWPSIGWPILMVLVLLLAAGWAEPFLARRSSSQMIVLGGADLGSAQGWSAKEWSDSLPGLGGPLSASYRWSGASSSLVFEPAAQGQMQEITLRLIGGRANGADVKQVRLSANGSSLSTINVSSALRRYHVFVPGELASDQALTLTIDAPTFRPPSNSSRALGLIGLDARNEGVGAAPWVPRPTLALALGGLIALLLANGWPLRRAALAAAFGLAIAVAIGLRAPAATLASARTLSQLLLIAALAAGGARWWYNGRRRLRHPWRWAAALMIVLTALTFTPTMSADGVEYYAYLRSLAIDHDLDFTNEYTGPDVPFERVPTALARIRTPIGMAGNLASVGPAIAWAPFYVVGDLIARIADDFGASWTTDGYSLPYIAMINMASAASLPLTIWLCYLIARRVAERGIALLTAVSLVAGSAIIDYGLFEAHYPHAIAATIVAAYFYWWLRTRPDRTTRQWIVLGVLAGLMALMYWINAILMLLPALDLLPRFVRALRGRSWRTLAGLVTSGLIFLATTLLTFSPQMIAWKILYGSLFTIPHGASFAEPGGFKALEMLFSPEHGQLLWAPITCVGMLGMGWYIAHRRWEGLLVLLTFVLYFLYNATLGSWHGGGPFGLRRIANVLPLLTPGLACILAWLSQRARTAAATVCGLCLAWNAGLLLRFLAYLIPHHPGELGNLTVGEFLLAPDNLPWSKLAPIVSNALLPRLTIQAARHPASATWAPLGLLLGAIVVICSGTIALIAWLHIHADGEAPPPAHP